MTKRIAVLGCSLSDEYYAQGHHSWSYYLAKDNPNIEVVNFAVQTHGWDYARLVLNWMCATNYHVDAIIMNIPPMYRKYELDCKINQTEDFADMFKTHTHKETDTFLNESDAKNLFICRPTVNRILYCTNVYYCDDSRDSVESNTAVYKKSFERNVLRQHITSYEHRTEAEVVIPAYENKLNAPIFYYMSLHPTGMKKLVNLENQTCPQTIISSLDNKKFMLDTGHFTAAGNNLFYREWIKKDTRINSILERLKND